MRNFADTEEYTPPYGGVGPDPRLDMLLGLVDLYSDRYQLYKNREFSLLFGRQDGDDIEKDVKNLRDVQRFSKRITDLEFQLFAQNGPSGGEDGIGLQPLIEGFRLSDDEVRILLILVWFSIKTTIDNHSYNMTSIEVLYMIYLDKLKALNNLELFAEKSKLISNNLIERPSENGNHFRRKTDFLFQPTKRTLIALLGKVGEGIYSFINYEEVKRRVIGGSAGGESSLNIYKPRVKLEDVTLPQETRDVVMEGLTIVEQKGLLFDEWGIDRVVEKGRGTILLFCGPPGTGKTMTAEALANYLGKDVCSINIAQLENCFVGVTEKNIEAVFKEARERNLFLLFDECDSLISSRSEEGSIHRYYNKVVNILLREIEEFEGVLVMTTNRDQSLDEALERRVALRVRFNMPGYDERVAIWERFLSLEGAVSEDVDVELLAKEYELSGGEIKNAFIAGARTAARRVQEGNGERLITMEDLQKGCKLAKDGAGIDKGSRMGF